METSKVRAQAQDQPRRTPEEIRELKINWREDPCWDIETTEGFEAHHEELLAYRLEIDREAEERRQLELEETAERLGVPGNLKLARYVELLEYTLDQLGERVDRLEGE
ncbi:MAG: hypothetical protein M3R38_04430 [Actinomycetota bacterium]|nr:hypothetical protein [Actinomycetota bacterium]MDP9484323.1 hypothetical protein [Actinomycetota bacterium]